MNVINMLKKQSEAGKNIIMPDGNVVSEDGIKKAAMKEYLAGVKDGTISPAISLDTWMKENISDYASVQEVINFIAGTEEPKAAE